MLNLSIVIMADRNDPRQRIVQQVSDSLDALSSVRQYQGIYNISYTGLIQSTSAWHTSWVQQHHEKNSDLRTNVSWYCNSCRSHSSTSDGTSPWNFHVMHQECDRNYPNDVPTGMIEYYDVPDLTSYKSIISHAREFDVSVNIIKVKFTYLLNFNA
jgi:hypothetical protein